MTLFQQQWYSFTHLHTHLSSCSPFATYKIWKFYEGINNSKTRELLNTHYFHTWNIQGIQLTPISTNASRKTGAHSFSLCTHVKSFSCGMLTVHRHDRIKSIPTASALDVSPCDFLLHNLAIATSTFIIVLPVFVTHLKNKKQWAQFFRSNLTNPFKKCVQIIAQKN